MSAGSLRLRGFLFAIVGVVTTLSTLVLIGGLSGVPDASAAATAPAAAQCNPPAFPTGAGFQVTCTMNIANTVSAGASSSTITATACLAVAGVAPPFGCTTTVTTSNQLVTSVNQCNGIVFGGGSNVTCSVSVVNTIPTGNATTGVTVNQCIGSGTGGGIEPTVVCAPVASTTNATVTQCNGSGNGGGASTRVQCDVTGTDSAEPVTINQCNGSSNGGGSTVTCMSTFTNNFVSTVPTTTTTTTVPTAPTTTTLPVTPPTTPTSPPHNSGSSGVAGTTPGSPPKGTGAVGVRRAGAVGSGVTGRTGSAAGAGGSTGTSQLVGASGVIPSGAPQTGFGGASRSRNSDLFIPGGLAIAGAVLAMIFAIRRRRSLPHQGAHETS